VYAGVSDGSAPGEVYRSTDAGATWQKLSTGIPPLSGTLALNIAALNFAADGSVLLGVTYGNLASGGAAYRSTDGGQTWQWIAGGLATYNPFDLTSTSNRIDPISSADPSERNRYGALSIFAGTDGDVYRQHRARRVRPVARKSVSPDRPQERSALRPSQPGRRQLSDPTK
jgi:hypothetical protein